MLASIQQSYKLVILRYDLSNKYSTFNQLPSHVKGHTLINSWGLPTMCIVNLNRANVTFEPGNIMRKLRIALSINSSVFCSIFLKMTKTASFRFERKVICVTLFMILRWSLSIKSLPNYYVSTIVIRVLKKNS